MPSLTYVRSYKIKNPKLPLRQKPTPQHLLSCFSFLKHTFLEKTKPTFLLFISKSIHIQNTPYQRTSKPLRRKTKILLGWHWANRTNPLFIMSKHAHRPKAPSPTNAANFLSEGWATKERPIRVVVPGQKNDIIDYKDY
jgi:hypothetical protein